MRVLLRKKQLLYLTASFIALSSGLHFLYRNAQPGINDYYKRAAHSISVNRNFAPKSNTTKANQVSRTILKETIISTTLQQFDRQPTFSYLEKQFVNTNDDLETRLPDLSSYLTHLAFNKSLLSPQYRISRGRNNVSFVIGIPSIRRPVDSYVINTLKYLIDGMNETDKGETLLIVCITEPWNTTYERKIILDILKKFPKEVESGLIDIITPRAGYYPDLNQLNPNLNDPPERVRWRSKQNLDYVYLMLHSWNRGKYYLQLEDDIQAIPGYISAMKKAILDNYGNWFLLQFSTLGFIGRLFKSHDVLKVMEFLVMFYSSKPCDWLLDDFLRVKMCGHGDIWGYCIHKIRSAARIITPSLFQHEGFHSSFSGNINKLKDKHFGPDGKPMFFNPPLAGVINDLLTYEKYDMYAMYNGDEIFWGSNPKAGDVIDFLFENPCSIYKILIETGNKDHPSDIIRDASVEILPEEYVLDGNSTRNTRALSDRETSANRKRYDFLPQLKNKIKDSFHILGSFNSEGVFSMDVPKKFGNIWTLRISFHSNSETWIIIKKLELHRR